jgi:hypothetical protein
MAQTGIHTHVFQIDTDDEPDVGRTFRFAGVLLFCEGIRRELAGMTSVFCRVATETERLEARYYEIWDGARTALDAGLPFEGIEGRDLAVRHNAIVRGFEVFPNDASVYLPAGEHQEVHDLAEKHGLRLAPGQYTTYLVPSDKILAIHAELLAASTRLPSALKKILGRD